MKKFLWGLLIVVAGSVMAIILVRCSGGRGFFSPDTLEYRSQTEILCPGIEVPLFRGSFRYHDHELVRFLIDKGYWRARKVDSPRWLSLFHCNRMWRDGESTFHRQFFWRKSDWIDWTNKNPNEAALFWPRVLELLRLDDEERAVELLRGH